MALLEQNKSLCEVLLAGNKVCAQLSALCAPFDCPVLPCAQHRSRKVSDETLERVSELAMHNRTLVRGRESAVHEPAKNSGLGQRTSGPHSSKLATETSPVRRKYI